MNTKSIHPHLHQNPFTSLTCFNRIVTKSIAILVGVGLQLHQTQLWHGLTYALLFMAAVFILLFQKIPPLLKLKIFQRWSFVVVWQICILLTWVVAAFTQTGWRAHVALQSTLPVELENIALNVVLRITDLPKNSTERTQFEATVESAMLPNGKSEGVDLDVTAQVPKHVQLGWYAARTKQKMKNDDADANPNAKDSTDSTDVKTNTTHKDNPNPNGIGALKAGQRWQMTVKLKRPHGNSNWTGNDTELAWWRKDIRALGSVRNGKKDTPPRWIENTWHEPVAQLRHYTRERILQTIQQTHSQLHNEAGVVAALVMGDQSAIDETDWQIFRRTGVAHLMSISGLHITIFAWLAIRLVGALWRRSMRLCLLLPAPKAAILGGIFLATLYAIFSGWGVPSQRTVWMLVVVMGLRYGGLQWPFLSVLALAAAVVVSIDPWAISQAGFWLSFVAVGVLFLTDTTQNPHAYSVDVKWNGGDDTERNEKTKNTKHPNLSRWLYTLQQKSQQAMFGLWQTIWQGLREQLRITFALLPLTLLLFGQISTVSLLANAVAIGIVTFIVTPLAMVGVVWSTFWVWAAQIQYMLDIYLAYLSNWPWASWSTAIPPLWLALLAMLGMGLACMKLPWRWRLMGLLLCLPALLWQPMRPVLGQFEVLFLDVGQGNAVVVRTKNHTLVYDGGPQIGQDPHSDAGERIVVPELQAHADPVSMVMLSHRDSDHSGGIDSILQSGTLAAKSTEQLQFLSSIEDTHPLQSIRKAQRCEAGQHWQWDGVDFVVLHPKASDYGVDESTSNSMSCVLKIKTIASPFSSVLLVGDLGTDQEERLVAEGADIKSDVLLMPHHGSKTSSSDVFLDAVAPTWAVAQTGYLNHYRHPAASVLERYTARNIAIINTPICGAARWASDAPKKVLCHRTQLRRYWHFVAGD